jgi:hypothetical protein
MKTVEAEKALCKIYINSYNNQKLSADYTCRLDSVRDRLKNLNKQFPYDMPTMLKKHGMEL